jgi:hypothetical protein
MESLESPENRVSVGCIGISFLDNLNRWASSPTQMRGRSPFGFESQEMPWKLESLIGGLTGGAVLTCGLIGGTVTIDNALTGGTVDDGTGFPGSSEAEFSRSCIQPLKRTSAN